MTRTKVASFILLTIILAMLFYGWALIFVTATAGAEPPRWRCWADKVIRHGEARCTVVFDADSKWQARRYALRMCEEECGGRCEVQTCTPHRGK